MKFVLFAGVAASAVLGGAAYAQEAGGQTTAVTEIVVTGSRIKRPQFDGTIPGVQVTKEEIIQRGFNNAYDIVLSQPQVGSGASPYGSNGGQTSSLGVAYADLLNLGPQRTLTLVNGRRMVSSNASTLFVSGNYAGSQVDISAIPAQMIDHVDTLTVGGAAAYGSDAIAGVINYIIKDRFVGAEARAAFRTTDKGDANRYSFNAIYGSNLFNDRANLVVSFEYTKTDALYADDRPWYIDTATSVTNAFNGAKRNPNFSPTAAIDVANLNNGAFLRTSDDGIPSTAYAYNSRTAMQWASGVAFAPTSGTSACAQKIVGVNSCVAGGGLITSNLQLVPGIPTGNGIYAGTLTAGMFPNFAPATLPSTVTAAQVFAKYGVTAPTGLTGTQLNTLALNVLQSKLPTLREYLLANPNTDINLIVGSLYTNMPRVANTDPRTSALFPFIAKPVRFTDAGEAVNWSFANIGATDQGTISAAPGTKGYDNSRYTLIQNAQKRKVGTLFGTFDVNDHLTFYTQNIFSSVSTRLPRNAVSSNSVTSTGVETSGLYLSINNPYLSATSRQVLRDSGAVNTAGNFLLSRTNQDLLGDNPLWGKTDTSNLVNGLKGDFDLLGRNWTWDASYTWGRSSGRVDFNSIKDIEYNLAIDTTLDASGKIVCRAQTNPSAYLGKSPNGVTANLVDQPGANGVITKTPYTPVVTQSMIDSCQPLNPFGYGQMSAAARAYVTTPQFFAFENTQTFLQGSISGDLFNLPAGPVGVAVSGERRTTNNDYWVDNISQYGRTRSAAIARTAYETTAQEYGVELNIPLLGGDFSLPFAERLDINPAVRWSKQTGSAPSFVNALGKTINPDYDGDTAKIWSLAGTFQPIKDISFRGNITRSIRQPDGVELFLGGQPAFTTPADPCSTANIGGGSNPANRKANCIAAVKAAGYAVTDADALNFLNSYSPPSLSLLGARFGNMGLKPEKGESWTAGVVLAPRFIPGLRMSIDYADIKLKDQLSRVSLDQLSAYCYDSAVYPNNQAQFGTNTCDAFARYTSGAEPTSNLKFAMKDGWSSSYLNLGQSTIRSVNAVVSYRFNLAELVRQDGDLGRISINSNVFRTLESTFSPTGLSSDNQYYLGAFNPSNNTGASVPRWQSNTTIAYSLKKFTTSVNIGTVSDTIRFSGSTPATIENNAYLTRKGYAVYNLYFGYDLTEKLQLRFNVNNVADKRFEDQRDGTIYSTAGRTWQFAINAKF
jgi:outer membrane receptor protein involved in Fe transport